MLNTEGGGIDLQHNSLVLSCSFLQQATMLCFKFHFVST